MSEFRAAEAERGEKILLGYYVGGSAALLRSA